MGRARRVGPEREPRCGRRSLRPSGEREQVPVFSPLAPEQFALGVETIYEAYLVHYGRSRLFAPAGRGRASPARRLPLRARPRPDRRRRRRRRGRGDGRADLPLRRPARRRRRAATATRGSSRRAPSAASPADDDGGGRRSTGTPLESACDRGTGLRGQHCRQRREAHPLRDADHGALLLCWSIAIGELTQLGGPPPQGAQARRPRVLTGATRLAAHGSSRRSARVDRAPRAGGRARPRRRRGRPVPRGDRDRRPHGQGRRACAPVRAAEGQRAPAAREPVRHRAPHVPRVRRRAARRRGGEARRRARDAAAARASSRRCAASRS